jgi:hypothetical protein
MMLRSTDQAVEVHQQHLDAKWGKDGSFLTTACMGYRFSRHFMLSQGIGARCDIFISESYVQGLTEHTGNVQQMVALFQNQLGAMQEFTKRGVPGMELPFFWLNGSASFVGLELKVLHPFGEEVAALRKLCEGGCTDPSGCEGWLGSTDWSASLGSPSSSKDGLHHAALKATILSHVQAVLSLALASTSTSDFDLSWLDGLPAADDVKLHDSMKVAFCFANTRVLIAEVFEWQGRHKEAIRFVISHTDRAFHSHAHN